jgi:hypothetical protein
MKRYFACVLIIVGLTANAQTFIRHFNVDSVSTLAYSVVDKDSFFFVAGVCVDTANPSAIKSFLIKFDNAGNNISETTFRPPDFINYYFTAYGNGLINTSDGGIAATGVADDTSGQEFISFTKFDSAGVLSFYKVYSPPIASYRHALGYKILERENCFYIIGSIQLSNYYVAPCITKIDKSGNFLFFKYYNSLPYLYGGLGTVGVCSLPNGNLIISVGREEDIGLGNYWQTGIKTCFLEVDTAGNLINHHCTSDTNTWSHFRIDVTTDGNFISSGSYYTGAREQGISFPFTQYIAKWDTSFHPVWQLNSGNANYEDNAYTDFEQNGQNEIIACGQSVGDSNIIGFYGCIAKINSTGQIQWYRSYQLTPPNYVELHFYDVDLLQNGDIISVGSWESSNINVNPFGNYQVGCIIRVDSNGCMDNGSCGLTGIDEPPPQQQVRNLQPINIYPNPSNGIFTVSSTFNLPAFSSISIYGVTGQFITNQPLFSQVNLVNLCHLPNGIYFYEIGNGLTKVQSGKIVIQK